MDEIFGYMDGRLEVSLADSTMMWIVHCAMNRAQEKMKTKTGVLERLNEISKFYELAVMQLEGCLSIVHDAETESSCYFLESNHEEVLDDLREIKDRLQGRLEESELAILEKDKELTYRLKNELQLRHALELKERELVSLGGIEESSHNSGNDQARENEHGGDDDLCELRTSMDQQMLNIKQRLEPQHHDIGSEVPHNSNDTKKIEEMGSDIDILKQTMDLAFGRMQSAIFVCEMGPKERQWKLTIEKDITSIVITSFMREFQENIEEEARRNENRVHKFWQEHWSHLMNEVTNLRNELATMHEICPEDSDSSNLSSPTKPSPEEESHEERDHKEGELPEEEENEIGGSNYVSKLIKNHESIICQKNEELNRIKHRISQEKKASSSKKRKEINSLKERIHIVTERLDNLITWNGKLSESLLNLKTTHDKETLSMKKLSEVYENDRVVKNVDTQGLIVEKVKGVSDVGNKVQEEIKALSMENGHNTMQNLISEDKYSSIYGLVEKFDPKSYNIDLEKLIQEHVYKCYLREIINEWNASVDQNAFEGKIREDINLIVFSEVVKDISANQQFVLVKCQGGEAEDRLRCSTYSDKVDEIESTIKEDVCMLMFRKTVEEFNKIMVSCDADNIIREQIGQAVFVETLTNFVNIASSASIDHRDNIIQVNFIDQLQFMIIECFLKEDVCMVVFKSMLKEWKFELDNYEMDNFIREKIQQVIIVETLNDVFQLPMEFKSSVPPIKDNNTLEDNCSTVILNQVKGEENLSIILLESLLSCFEAEENLMLSARSEIKEHSKQLDLGSERGDLHEHEIFEDLLTGEEQTFSSLTSKVENVLQQLGISKALLKELGTRLGHSLRDSEIFHNQMFANEEGQLKLQFSFEPPKFAEFEAMVYQKFEIMTTRLEKMKCCLNPVLNMVNCMRRKELLYQKAFIRRCQNLQKAEAEVDLLGDQVDALLTLLEKIYVTLHRYAPTLQQYFEVFNILKLIKTQLVSGVVQAASVLT